MAIIDTYKNLITSQHAAQPKFMTWLSNALTPPGDNLALLNSIYASFDIDLAVGIQLDTLGTIIGRSRTLNFSLSGGVSPVLDDMHYRLALKAKIAQNQWDGTIPQIYAVWSSLFPATGLTVIDNQDMTMSALINGALDSISTQLVSGGYIIPKPTGVGLKIINVSSAVATPFVGALVNGTTLYALTVPNHQ